MMLLFVIAVVLVASARATTFTIDVGAANTISFSPSALTIAPGDTINFAFQRAGDSVVSAANNVVVCPDGATPVASSCVTAVSPLINITGPGSGQPLFTRSINFPDAGVFSVVNPTYCQVPGTAELSCNAKAVISVVSPSQTPSPGSTIVVIGVNGTQTVFPSPLVVTTGHDVWFRFDAPSGLTEVDSNGVVVTGGLSCPISIVGQFCKWTLTAQRSYYYQASPFTFGGRIDSRPNVVIPSGSVVVEVGQTDRAFTVPPGSFPIGTVVYFRFNTYGPYRVQRGDGPTCQAFVGTGAFDSFFQEAGRVWPIGISTIGITYFFDPSFCLSNSMAGQVVATGVSSGGDFVDVTVAPRNPITNLTELVFDPSPAVVYQGGSVRWTWTDFGHTVTESLNNDMNLCLPQPGGYDSGFIQPPVNGQGGTFTHQYNTLGTFYYFCKAHCANSGMRGTVIVVPRPQNIITHGVIDTNPNRFSPPVLTVYPNDTVCWDFITAGDIVQSQYYRDCIALPGGFNSGFQPVGARVCRVFTGATCTAFYYFDSQQCASNGMYGVVLLSDRPAMDVVAASNVFVPPTLNVTVGQTVIWTFVAAGNSVTQIPSLAQVTNPDVAVRCATLAGGFNSGVVQNAPSTFSRTFVAPAQVAFITVPFCPFPSDFPGFYGSINVCDPIITRPTLPPTTTPPTTAPPTTAPPTCPPDDPCKPNQKKTVINFYFADILQGANAGCPTCGQRN